MGPEVLRTALVEAARLDRDHSEAVPVPICEKLGQLTRVAAKVDHYDLSITLLQSGLVGAQRASQVLPIAPRCYDGNPGRHETASDFSRLPAPMQSPLTIALDGFEPAALQSLNRTRRFYFDALTAAGVEVARMDACEGKLPDAALSFWGKAVFQPRQRDFPALVTLHGLAVVGVGQLARNLTFLDQSDCCIVNCRSDEPILRRLVHSPPNILELPLPVDRGWFFPRDPCPMRRRLGLEGDDIVLGFCGRLTPQKNVHRFLRMVAAIRHRMPGRQVKGLIIGDFGSGYPILNFGDEHYESQVRALARALSLDDRLIWLRGNLSSLALAQVYSAMDVLLVPSNVIDENFGYVAVEAMACGTPVIACAYGGLKDTVISGQTGYLMDSWVTPGGLRADYASGVRAACQILEEPDTHTRLSARAAAHTSEKFAFDPLRERLTQGIHQAIEQRRQLGSRPVGPMQERPAHLPHHLPETEPAFSAYRWRCAAYASGPPPEVEELSWVETFAPLRALGAGRYQVLDEAWPSIHNLDPDELQLLRLCEPGIRIDDVVSRSGSPRAQVRARLTRLIAEGLLLGSRPTARWKAPDQ